MYYNIYTVLLIKSHLKWKYWILIGGLPGNIRSVAHLSGNVPRVGGEHYHCLSCDHRFEYVLGLNSYKDSITKSSIVFTVF